MIQHCKCITVAWYLLFISCFGVCIEVCTFSFSPTKNFLPRLPVREKNCTHLLVVVFPYQVVLSFPAAAVVCLCCLLLQLPGGENCFYIMKQLLSSLRRQLEWWCCWDNLWGSWDEVQRVGKLPCKIPPQADKISLELTSIKVTKETIFVESAK